MKFYQEITVPLEKEYFLAKGGTGILYRCKKVNWRIGEETNELKQSPPVNYVWDKSNFQAQFTMTWFSACILISELVHFTFLKNAFHMWTTKFSFYRRNICVVVALLNKKKNQKRTFFFKKEIFIIQRTNIFPKVRFSMNLQIKSFPPPSLPPPHHSLFFLLFFFCSTLLNYTNFENSLLFTFCAYC